MKETDPFIQIVGDSRTKNDVSSTISFSILYCGKYCFEDWNLFLHKNPYKFSSIYFADIDQNYHVLVLWKALFPNFAIGKDEVTNKIEKFQGEPSFYLWGKVLFSLIWSPHIRMILMNLDKDRETVVSCIFLHLCGKYFF